MAPQQGGFSWSNVAVGAAMNMFEVTTLGQPFEVIKTQMASNRKQTMAQALKTVWSRGGVFGFYQGLIPWAWIEASTKGAVLIWTASGIDGAARSAGLAPGWAGLLGGMGGGVAQAYATMGFCTTMKTAEITRHKQAATGAPTASTWALFGDIYRREGIKGINKGVNAVAFRQMTNWGSRMGFARLAEVPVRKLSGKTESDKLSAAERIACSSIGGTLATWNQPIEVVRIEMQSMAKDPNRPANMSILSTAKYIYSQNGILGLYRGVTPRICLGIWQTVRPAPSCVLSSTDALDPDLHGHTHRLRQGVRRGQNSVGGGHIPESSLCCSLTLIRPQSGSVCTEHRATNTTEHRIRGHHGPGGILPLVLAISIPTHSVGHYCQLYKRRAWTLQVYSRSYRTDMGGSMAGILPHSNSGAVKRSWTILGSFARSSPDANGACTCANAGACTCANAGAGAGAGAGADAGAAVVPKVPNAGFWPAGAPNAEAGGWLVDAPNAGAGWAGAAAGPPNADPPYAGARLAPNALGCPKVLVCPNALVCPALVLAAGAPNALVLAAVAPKAPVLGAVVAGLAPNALDAPKPDDWPKVEVWPNAFPLAGLGAAPKALLCPNPEPWAAVAPNGLGCPKELD